MQHIKITRYNGIIIEVDCHRHWIQPSQEIPDSRELEVEEAPGLFDFIDLLDSDKIEVEEK